MIQISSQELAARSAAMKNQLSNMRSLFSAVTARIRSMDSAWSSPASRAFVSEYETLIPLYENYCQTAEAFTLYLDQTAASYQDTEQMLAAAMSA